VKPARSAFRGVKKEMFIRTIIYLDLHYVSVINYTQMARKAIEQCKLLGEVVGTSSRFSRNSRREDTASKKTELEVLDEKIWNYQSFFPSRVLFCRLIVPSLRPGRCL